jgi:hypothetical protein
MAQPPQLEVLGYDTHFQLGNTNDWNTATTWTDIFAEPIDIKPPDQKTNKIKSSHMQSPGQVEQKVMGWTDTGECDVSAHYNYTEYAAIRAYGRAQQSFRIVFNDPGNPGTSSNRSGIQFNGMVADLARKVNMEGLVTTELKIEVTGQTSDIDTIAGVT